jgi:hypothetical protein
MSGQSRTTYDTKLEMLKYKAEALKQQYDFFKHMTTLNTGSILIIVALMQSDFQDATVVCLVIISIVLFFGSLVCSVIQMFLYSGVLSKHDYI